MRGFYGLSLEMVYIASVLLPLGRTQSHGYNSLQGRLENKAYLCVQEEKEAGFRGYIAVSATHTHLNRSAFNLFLNVIFT